MIVLQNFIPDDYDRLIGWVDSPELLMQFAGPGFAFPLTHEQLEASLRDEKRRAYKVVETGSETTIGHAEIYETDNSAHLGRILIGDAAQRGRGTGQQIVARLLHIAFTGMGKPFATLNVFDWNRSAIRCYEKAGFVVNPDKAVKRVVNGQTWTALNMVLQKAEWDRRQEG